MNRPLVMFGEDWGGLPSSTQHLAKHFAQDRPVLWVNSLGLRRPRLQAHDMRRAIGKVRAMASGQSSPSSSANPPLPAGLHVLNPRAIPWPGNPVTREINRRVLGEQLRRKLRDLGWQAPILWTSLPTAVEVVGELGEALVVYYCCDDFGSLAGVDHAAVSALESELMERSDIVFATSPSLEEKFGATRPVLLSHGVDLELFSQKQARPADLPDGQTLLFYGSISEWIDVDLIAELAGRRPDWTFVMIGAVTAAIEALLPRPNVRFLGPKRHAELPGYAQHADAVWLPFRDTPQIQACNPLKLREYLATGTPVLATPFPALMPYRHHVAIGQSAEEFASLLDGLDTTSDAVSARQSSVAGETWSARAAEALSAMDAALT